MTTNEWVLLAFAFLLFGGLAIAFSPWRVDPYEDY